MPIGPNTVLYFDTNALIALNFRSEVCRVLESCKAGTLSLCLSEWVIFEFARKWFVRERDEALFPQVPLLEKYLGKKQGDILQAYYIFFKQLFENHSVNIIFHSDELRETAKIILSDQDSYFSADNFNDQRDALILASAIQTLDPDHSVIVCQETKKLSAEFARRGFTVRSKAKDLIRELPLQESAPRIIAPNLERILQDGGEHHFPPHFDLALRELDATYAELFFPGKAVGAEPILEVEVAERRVEELGEHDRDVRFEILAYVHWFAPVKKEDLIEMLAQRQLQEKIVLNNAGRLVMAESIRDTGTHFLPGRDGVCEAIGNSRVEEFIELLRAG